MDAIQRNVYTPGMIIYGLGNTGSKYTGTRHNVGRDIVTSLAGQMQSKQGYSYKTIEGKTYLVSNGFMNDSGVPLASFIGYFKHASGPLIILQDDSDQVEGSVKLLPKGGSGGHHGINSIYAHILKTPFTLDDIWRVKIGIRPQGNALKSETFVLSRSSAVIDKVAEKLAATLQAMPVSIDLAKLQNTINGKI